MPLGYCFIRLIMQFIALLYSIRRHYYVCALFTKLFTVWQWNSSLLQGGSGVTKQHPDFAITVIFHLLLILTICLLCVIYDAYALFRYLFSI